ncbi:MAG: mitochondrial fission ELM1 family protein [Candidatus Omnitrophica bacterium]|nr:mitochondrial fission ELM1 family protein [Candidatus Omnitrophota bacterium]
MGKLNSFQGSIACFILKAFAVLLRILPMPATLWVGRRIGEAVCFLGAKNARKTRNNIKVAFGSRKSRREIDQIIRGFYHLYGQNIVELAQLPLIAKRGFEKYVEVEGREHVAAAMKKGKGLIFLSMHSGNWELSNIVGSMSGYPYSMVANYLEQIDKIADYLDSLRQSAGCNIINPGVAGREIIKRLKKNEIVTLVADQGGEEGVLVPFFGREASMSTGAVRLALKYGASICLVDIHRVGTGRHRLVAKPFDVVDTGDTEKDVRLNMEKIASWFQARIEEHPSEYIWSYGTWKYSSVRHLVVLDDGRTGHLRQSEAVARHLKIALEEASRIVTTQTLRVEYKSGWHAFFLGLIAWLRFPFMPKDGRMLKPFLTAETVERLSVVKADFVVSCGARNAVVNYCFSQENYARNIAILRPGMVPYDYFKLVVLPEHDRVSGLNFSNLLLTKAAPNLIDKDYLEDNKRRLLNRFSHLKMNLAPKFGVLIGGDAKGVTMTERQMKVIFHQLKEIAQRYGAEFLITTSRRTSLEIDRLVMKEFKDYGRTALLVVANRNNVPEAVGGILALSDVLIVSGESISMVSEATSSGKKTIVFPIDGNSLRPVENKYFHFVEELGKQGHIIYTETRGMGQAVDDALKGKIMTRPIHDQGLILEAMRKIIA